MGKQTIRQMAKRKANTLVATAAPPSPPDSHLCCLPHCEEPGEKLICGHRLCDTDLLKLSKLSLNVRRFLLQCPMCRTEHVMTTDRMTEPLLHQPFKCAKFECACAVQDCGTSYVACLHACTRHKNYDCKVCTGPLTKPRLLVCDTREFLVLP